jgi:hypothetical protein
VDGAGCWAVKLFFFEDQGLKFVLCGCFKRAKKCLCVVFGAKAKFTHLFENFPEKDRTFHNSSLLHNSIILLIPNFRKWLI